MHDELCFSIESEDKHQDQGDYGNSLELKVPSKVDQELGDNWERLVRPLPLP